MTFFDDPNRECVGLDPIWGDETRDNDPLTPVGREGDEFDPSRHTIAEVEEYLDANPDEIDRVLAAELDGKNRHRLVNRYSEDDDED